MSCCVAYVIVPCRVYVFSAQCRLLCRCCRARFLSSGRCVRVVVGGRVFGLVGVAGASRVVICVGAIAGQCSGGGSARCLGVLGGV